MILLIWVENYCPTLNGGFQGADLFSIPVGFIGWNPNHPEDVWEVDQGYGYVIWLVSNCDSAVN